MSDEPIVFLAYSNPKALVDDSDRYMLACRRCKNKTYRHECGEGCAALVYCAACGQYIGKMGWYPEDDPPAA